MIILNYQNTYIEEIGYSGFDLLKDNNAYPSKKNFAPSLIACRL